MKFNVFIKGKKLDKHYIDAIAEYDKRLSRYCKIKLHILKDESEFERKIPQGDYKIKVFTKGKSISSEGLAEKITTLGVRGKSSISLIVSDYYESYDETMMLSTMDMEAGLTATVVFEQIYRGFRINSGEAYHK